MRNRIQGRQLGRDSEHRTAMLRNLAAGLFEHGQIETTMPKAKVVQPFIEKIITIAKKGGLHSRRQIEARINDRMIHGWVADSNVPDSCKDNEYFDLPDASDIEFNRYGELRKAPRLVQHIMTAIADRYRDRDGGYTPSSEQVDIDLAMVATSWCCNLLVMKTVLKLVEAHQLVAARPIDAPPLLHRSERAALGLKKLSRKQKLKFQRPKPRMKQS